MANKELTTDEIQMISLSELKPYEDAPFKVRDDDNMKELVQSIKDSGILVPLIARPHAEGGYEILAGHRRAKASEKNNLEKVPVIVKDFDDDAAIILLVDSNIHPENILPSEKARAYDMKLEAIKRQGKRTDLTSAQVGQKSSGLTSKDILAEQVGESRNQIQRYILNNLVDHILEMVDEKKIPFNTGVEMSYLSAKQQTELLTTIDEEDNTIPTIDQVRQMRKYADEGKLSKNCDGLIENKVMNRVEKAIKNSENRTARLLFKQPCKRSKTTGWNDTSLEPETGGRPARAHDIADNRDVLCEKGYSKVKRSHGRI